jgi:hypothetical protein
MSCFPPPHGASAYTYIDLSLLLLCSGDTSTLIALQRRIAQLESMTMADNREYGIQRVVPRADLEHLYQILAGSRAGKFPFGTNGRDGFAIAPIIYDHPCGR